MPEIDVTDVLLDPMVAGEGFLVVRRQEKVDEHGRSNLIETRWMAVGNVQPTGSQSLVREEAYEAQNKTLQVITKFRLRGESQDNGKNFQPDLILWNGGYYIVKTVDDWNQYGAGMIAADCVAYNYVDNAPPGSPATAPAAGVIFSNPANSALAAGVLPCF